MLCYMLHLHGNLREAVYIAEGEIDNFIFDGVRAKKLMNELALVPTPR